MWPPFHASAAGSKPAKDWLPKEDGVRAIRKTVLFGKQSYIADNIIFRLWRAGRDLRPPVGAALPIRMHEVANLPISGLRSLMVMRDRPQKYRVSLIQGKPKEG